VGGAVVGGAVVVGAVVVVSGGAVVVGGASVVLVVVGAGSAVVIDLGRTRAGGDVGGGLVGLMVTGCSATADPSTQASGTVVGVEVVDDGAGTVTPTSAAAPGSGTKRSDRARVVGGPASVDVPPPPRGVQAASARAVPPMSRRRRPRIRSAVSEAAVSAASVSSAVVSSVVFAIAPMRIRFGSTRSGGDGRDYSVSM
jgi:hypothetical protein